MVEPSLQERGTPATQREWSPGARNFLLGLVIVVAAGGSIAAWVIRQPQILFLSLFAALLLFWMWRVTGPVRAVPPWTWKHPGALSFLAFGLAGLAISAGYSWKEREPQFLFFGLFFALLCFWIVSSRVNLPPPEAQSGAAPGRSRWESVSWLGEAISLSGAGLGVLTNLPMVFVWVALGAAGGFLAALVILRRK